jgi:DNA-binding GntR family transcriptional regulator
VLSLLLLSVAFIVTEQVLTRTERGELEDHIVHDHRELAKAIINGDAELAANLMRDHIRYEVEHFREFWPLRIGETVQWR